MFIKKDFLRSISYFSIIIAIFMVIGMEDISCMPFYRIWLFGTGISVIASWFGISFLILNRLK